MLGGKLWFWYCTGAGMADWNKNTPGIQAKRAGIVLQWNTTNERHMNTGNVCGYHQVFLSGKLHPCQGLTTTCKLWNRCEARKTRWTCYRIIHCQWFLFHYKQKHFVTAPSAETRYLACPLWWPVCFYEEDSVLEGLHPFVAKLPVC